MIALAVALPSRRFQDSADSYMFFRTLFNEARGALHSFKLEAREAFLFELRTNIFDLSDRLDDIERDCLKS